MIGGQKQNYQTFNPKQVGNLVLWLDGSDPSANGIQPSNLQAISTWVDKSGTAHDFTQPSGSNQPLFIENYLGSLGSLNFNGISYMDAAYSDILNTTDTTVFVVCACNDETATWGTPLAQRGFVAGTFIAGFNFYKNEFSGGDSNKWDFLAGDGTTNEFIIDGVMTVDKNTLLSFSSTGGNATFFVDTVSKGTIPYVPQIGTSTNISRVGALNEVTAFFFPGYISEIIIYSSALSAAEYSAVEDYLVDKWGT